MPDGSQRVFFVSAERSGTTMFGLMLKAHRDIAYVPGFDFPFDAMTDDGRFPDKDRFLEVVHADRIFRGLGVAPKAELPPRDLADDLLQQVLDRQGGQLIVAKLCRSFAFLARHWDDAKFIHLVRDGRDVAPSIVGLGWAGNPEGGIDFWTGPEQAWSTLRQDIRDDQWIEIRYETLVSDTEGELRRLCAFLDLSFDPAMLEYWQTSTYAAPTTASAQKWRKKLTKRQIQRIEAKAGPLLEARGYPLSGYPHRPTPAWEAFAVRVQGRLLKIRARIRNYGLPLIAGLAITRRLGPKHVYKRLKLRVDEVTNSNLD